MTRCHHVYLNSIALLGNIDMEQILIARYTLNIWDVGGQRTLRPYWRNYFESTDAVVWVVDSSDRLRVKDCKDELRDLLQEEVSRSVQSFSSSVVS
jgi:ADP-ribosylation factor-like protein 2